MGSGAHAGQVTKGTGRGHRGRAQRSRQACPLPATARMREAHTGSGRVCGDRSGGGKAHIRAPRQSANRATKQVKRIGAAFAAKHAPIDFDQDRQIRAAAAEGGAACAGLLGRDAEAPQPGHRARGREGPPSAAVWAGAGQATDQPIHPPKKKSWTRLRRDKAALQQRLHRPSSSPSTLDPLSTKTG